MPLTQDLEHLVRPWIVADEVPGHPDPVRGDAIDVRKDGLEGGKIRVDVGEDRETHAATNELGLYHPLNKAGISRGLGDTMERFWPSTLNKVNITRERDSGSMAPPARQPHCFINFGAGPLFPSIRRLVMWCTALRGGGPLRGASRPPKGRGRGRRTANATAAQWRKYDLAQLGWPDTEERGLHPRRERLVRLAGPIRSPPCGSTRRRSGPQTQSRQEESQCSGRSTKLGCRAQTLRMTNICEHLNTR